VNPALLLESLPVAAILVRGDVVAWVNRAACALVGVAPEDLVGRHYETFLAPGEGRRVRSRRERRMRGEQEPTLYEISVRTASGRLLALELHIAPLSPDDLLFQFVDLSARAGHLERLEGLARLGARVQRETTREAVLAAVGAGLSDLGLVALRLRGAPGEMIVEKLTGPPATLAVLRTAGLEGEPAGRVVAEAHWRFREGVMYIDDAPLAAERITGLPAGIGEVVRAARLERAVVMRVGDPADVAIAAAGDWITPADVPAFRLFGAQVTAALASAQALAAVWARNQLVEISATAPGLAEFFARAGAVVQEALACDAIAVWLLDAERDELLLGHFRGDAPDLLAPFARIPVASSRYLAPLLRGGRPEVLGVDALDEPERRAFAAAGFQSFATVPLRIRSRVVGVMTAGFRQPGGANERVTGTLRSLAGSFAAAVETQRLVDDLRRRVSELELMNVTAVASATLDLRAMLGEALSRMLQTFGCDGGGAYTLEGGVLVNQALVGDMGSGAQEMLARIPADRGAAGVALRTLQPVTMSRDDPGAELVRRLAEHEHLESIAVAPLVVKNRALGILALGRRRPVPFRDVELQLLSAVASQLAVALENSRLFEDLTHSYAELGRAQTQLVQRERLAALGELSAVVAHEVRNPLAVIFNSLGSLQHLLRPSGDARVLLDAIQEEADRLNRIVGDLLDFARPSEPTIVPGLLGAVVEEALAAALAHAPPGIEVRRVLDAPLPPVRLDAHLVRQAVVNLVVNALQAMPRGGTLTLRTRADGDAAVVEVSDTGPGVAPGVRARVFEPFFTTKATGTGLGLAVVRRIAEGHGGSVEVESPPEGGARFLLRLPFAVGPDRMGAPSGSDAPAP
jgi:PAS domain S-box-containing protein